MSRINRITLAYGPPILPVRSLNQLTVTWEPGAVVIIRIRTRNELKDFRKLQTNHPGNHYVCVLHARNRNLLFNLFVFKPVKILFLPLDRKEVIKIFETIVEEKDVVHSKARFFQGVQHLSLSFTWETIDVDISIIARYLSLLFRRTGLCRSDSSEANFRLGLEEVLINAVEHGNLELNSADRQQNIHDQDRYDDLKKKRFQDPLYAKRKLMIELEINGMNYEIVVVDEGPGFDITKARTVFDGKQDLTEVDLFSSGGKGFWIIKKYFPSVHFSDGGRRIILSNKAD